MIFELLKKFDKSKVVKQHIAAFHKRFTDDQRKAILISLLIIANSDDEFHRKEEDYFRKISGQLDYDLEEDFIDEFFKMDRKLVYRILNDLDDDQKEWYMVTLFSMIHADGKSLDVEFDFARPFLEKMGIGQQQFEEAVQNSKFWKKSPPTGFLNG